MVVVCAHTIPVSDTEDVFIVSREENAKTNTVFLHILDKDFTHPDKALWSKMPL